MAGREAMALAISPANTEQKDASGSGVGVGVWCRELPIMGGVVRVETRYGIMEFRQRWLCRPFWE